MRLRFLVTVLTALVFLVPGCGGSEEQDTRLTLVTVGGPATSSDLTPGSPEYMALRSLETSGTSTISEEERTARQLALQEELNIIYYNDHEWVISQERLCWWDASEWINSLPGASWRFPTLGELRSLYGQGITSNSWGPFETCNQQVWTNETRTTSSHRSGGRVSYVERDEAKAFSFMDRNDFWAYAGNSAYGALAVR